ncbi:MAG: hypothetical protein M9928_04930 [Anaerolineae bacterium]|nr:hypothetical protein [Anaerolineae bacterium]
MSKRAIYFLLATSAIFLALLGTTLLVRDNRSINQKDGNALMQTANTLYAQERYDEATQLYEQLVASGLESRDLYFNLGNAYHLQGETGRSILNYERAAKIAPRDADVAANLATARALVEGQIVGATPEDNPLETLAAASSKWLTSNELAIATLLVWLLFGGLILEYRHRSAENRGRGFKSAIAIVGMFVILFGSAFASQILVEAQHTDAIVVTETIDISTGPGANYETLFSLHGGTDVYIQSRRGDWVQLTLPGTDVTGWIPALAVEAI